MAMRGRACPGLRGNRNALKASLFYNPCVIGRTTEEFLRTKSYPSIYEQKEPQAVYVLCGGGWHKVRVFKNLYDELRVRGRQSFDKYYWVSDSVDQHNPWRKGVSPNHVATNKVGEIKGEVTDQEWLRERSTIFTASKARVYYREVIKPRNARRKKALQEIFKDE